MRALQVVNGIRHGGSELPNAIAINHTMLDHGPHKLHVLFAASCNFGDEQVVRIQAQTTHNLRRGAQQMLKLLDIQIASTSAWVSSPA